MTQDGYGGLREQLEKMEWPSIFPFKFIVPIEKVDSVLSLFEKQDTTTKISRKGNYVSVTAKPFMYSSEHVIDKYKEANKIEGLLAL